MAQFLGAAAPPPPLRCDEEAFGELARFACRSESAFDQNAIDRALDRLVANPTRKASGKLLASRLFRDAQKHLKRKHRREFLDDDELETENRSVDPPTPLDLVELGEAVTVIRNGLLKLTPRDRQVLLAKTLNDPPETVGVGKRRFRTLLSDARSRLSEVETIDDARLVVMRALDKWRWETIDLLEPLAACLAGNN